MTAPRPRVNKWLVTVSVSFGTLMGAIDTSIVNVALPHIRGSVGATVEEITWVTTGFAIATGVLVAAVEHGSGLAAPLLAVAAVVILLQVLGPLHTTLSGNLGDRTAAWLYDRLTAACTAPAGIGHLEDPALATDLQVARDFDRGMTGPPLSISMDFIAAGLVCAGVLGVLLGRPSGLAPIVGMLGGTNAPFVAGPIDDGPIPLVVRSVPSGARNSRP